jgi:hypothetical protein
MRHTEKKNSKGRRAKTGQFTFFVQVPMHAKFNPAREGDAVAVSNFVKRRIVLEQVVRIVERKNQNVACQVDD